MAEKKDAELSTDTKVENNHDIILDPRLAEGKLLAEMTGYANDRRDSQHPDGTDTTWINKIEQVIVAFKSGENIAVHRLAVQHLFDTIPSLNDTVDGRVNKERWLDMLMGMSNPGYCLNPTAAHLVSSFYFQGFLLDKHQNTSSNLITQNDLQQFYDNATDPHALNTLIDSWQTKDFFATQSDTLAQSRYPEAYQTFAFECLKLLQEESITGNCLTSLADTISLAPLQEIVFEIPHDTNRFLKDVIRFRTDFRDFLFRQRVIFADERHLQTPTDLLKNFATFFQLLSADYSANFRSQYIPELKKILNHEALVLENLYSEITGDYQASFDALPSLLANIDLHKEWLRAGKPIETLRYDTDQNMVMISFSLQELKKNANNNASSSQVDKLMFRYLQQKNMTADILLKLSIPLDEADDALKTMIIRTKENSAKESQHGVTHKTSEKLTQRKILRAAGTNRIHQFLCSKDEKTLKMHALDFDNEARLEKTRLAADIYDKLVVEVQTTIDGYAQRKGILFTKKENSVLSYAYFILTTNTDTFPNVVVPNTAIDQAKNILEMLKSIDQNDTEKKAQLILTTAPQLFIKHAHERDAQHAAKAERGFVKVISELFHRDTTQYIADRSPYTRNFLTGMGWKQLLTTLDGTDRVISLQHGWGASEEVNSHRYRALLSQQNHNKKTIFLAMAQGGAHNTNFLHLTGNANLSDDDYDAAKKAGDQTIRIKLTNQSKDSFPGYAQNMLSMEKTLGIVAKPTDNLGHSMGGRIVLEKMLLVVSQHQQLLKTVTAHAEAPVLYGNEEGYQLLFDLTTLESMMTEVEKAETLREIIRIVLRGPAASINRLTMDKNSQLPEPVQELMTAIGKKIKITDQIFRLLVRNAPEMTKAVHRQQLDYRKSHLENQTTVLMNAVALLQSEAHLLQAIPHFFSISIHGEDQVLHPHTGLREATKIGGHVFEVPTLHEYTQKLQDMKEKIKVLLFPKTTHYGDGHEKGPTGAQVTLDTVRVLSAEIEQLFESSEQITEETVKALTLQLKEWSYNDIFGESKLTKPTQAHNAILSV